MDVRNFSVSFLSEESAPEDIKSISESLLIHTYMDISIKI